MTSRIKRTSKVVDYAAADNPFSDDDFSDFTPPSKKKEEKTKRRENDKENAQTRRGTKEKSLRQRLSLEERKFQRELEKALEISARETNYAQDFQGFKREENNEVTIAATTVTSEKPKSPASSGLTPENLVTTADVHSTLSGDETGRSVTNEANKSSLRSLEEEFPLGTSIRFVAKRPRIKVEFIEDDSDEWNSDIEEIRTLSDETDESDFCPSPVQKKKKKKSLKNGKPNGSRPQPSLRASPETRERRIRKVIERSPLKPKQEISVKIVAPAVGKNSLVSKITATSTSLPMSSSLSSAAETVKLSISPSTPKSTSSSRIGLVKKPFKSPTLGSTSPVSILQSSAASSRTGLRLGLSRRAHVKPLHPNASVR